MSTSVYNVNKMYNPKHIVINTMFSSLRSLELRKLRRKTPMCLTLTCAQNLCLHNEGSASFS